MVQRLRRALGPPDDDIEAKIQVDEAKYHAEYVKQSYPTLQQPAIATTTGQTMNGTIELKNVGTATWKAGVTKLAPTPRDKPSVLAGSAWLSKTRVSSPTADVAPGEQPSSRSSLTAGAPGDYTQTFSSSRSRSPGSPTPPRRRPAGHGGSPSTS